MWARLRDSHDVNATNNVNGGDDSIGTMFPLSDEDVVIEYRKAICHKFTRIHFLHYNLGITLQEVTSFIIVIIIFLQFSTYFLFCLLIESKQLC